MAEEGSARDEKARGRGGWAKKRWAGRGVKAWRKILRLEELLVKFRHVKKPVWRKHKVGDRV